MSRINGSEALFQQRFKDRMENIRKDGISGIMKNIKNPINNKNCNEIENWNNHSYQGINFFIKYKLIIHIFL